MQIKKQSWLKSLPRIFLWAHVMGVVGFYLVVWLRTLPNKKDRIRKLSAQEQSSISQEKPLVSIVVPARNEERNIRRCVQSLLEQDYDNYEVIVVDDSSTDGTGRILDDLARTHPNGKSLWILRLRDLPVGWAGKPHALHSGVLEANGTWFLFTDADTWHAPDALRTTLAQALVEQADFFTIVTTQELPTFWERVLMPMAYLGISMLYPPRLVNDPASPVAIANGQYILIRRTTYEGVGGYARAELRTTLLDDRDLAHVVKAEGFTLRFVEGAGLVHVHMYHGLADIWRGWRKNAYLGNRGGLGFVLLELFGLPMITLLPFLLPVYARLARTRRSVHIHSMEANVATVLELTPLLAYRFWLNRQLGVKWYYALTHPLAGAVFEGILAQSMWRVVTGKGVDWSGRVYHSSSQAKASIKDGEKKSSPSCTAP